jgi:hypothetical protein
VPPPPVCGAAVGYGAADGIVAGAVVGAVLVGFGVGEIEAWGLADAVGRVVAGVLAGDALAPPVAGFPVDGLWPVGDGVRVPGLLVDEACALGGGVGVKIDGTDEPPPVQAVTVIARRTAPAAERPAITHAPWAVTGVVRRIFMNPPRTRVR